MSITAGDRELLELAFDRSPAGMLVVDETGAILLVNREIERLFGYTRDELMGKPVETLIPARLRPPHAGHRDRYVSAPSSRPMGAGRDLFGLRKDGTEVPLEIGLNPIRTAHGLMVLGTVVDISTRKERSALEAQLSHSERLASIGMLAAGVGHEINNPLASLLAIVESLGRQLKRGLHADTDRTEALELVQLAEREVTRCRETTDKLVLLAQPYSVEPDWVDLNRAVLDTASLLNHQMNKQGVAWRPELDPSLPQLWARESGVRGVCLNLMMNAVQAMASGGTLRVVTSRDGAFAEMRVEDTGPGIAPENLERIWEPFFTTKPTGQGTGLGLAVTRSIVIRNGGTISAGNVSSGGARIVVRLPLDAPKGPDA
jgi:hypothetical protein